MRFRKATIADIPRIQAIEKDFYNGLKLPDSVLRDWIENLGKNFIVAEYKGKLHGCIFWEQLEKIRAIPYFHQSRDYHRPDGKYFYVSEVGVLNQKADLLQELFDILIEASKKKKLKGIIWVTGMDEEGHDALERNLIKRNGFKKFKPAGQWEYAPGKFSEAHWIFLKQL
jgi:hypothetical protein